MSKVKSKDKKTGTVGEPTIEQRMQNIVAADQTVRRCKRDLKTAREHCKALRADLQSAEKARDELLAEIEKGLPLMNAAKPAGKAKP